MRLTGILVTGGKSVCSVRAECGQPDRDFHDRLEEAFVMLCRGLGISVPVWLEKNTKELSMCRKTSFYCDQFDGDFPYDRFEMRIDRL
jgi:hypothetical protein